MVSFILGMISFLISATFWLSCVGVPLWMILWGVILSTTQSAAQWNRFWDPTIVILVTITLKQALLSTGIAAFFGFFIGLWMGTIKRGRIASFCHAFLMLPYGVPTVVAGTAWVGWLGRSGFLANLAIMSDWAYTLRAVILAHVMFNIPLIAAFVSRARLEVPSLELEAASGLGASVLVRFRYVIWPRVRFSFASACIQTFSLCVMSFALVLILGGGPRVQTLETAIYSKIRSGTLDISGASVCALWELIITVVPWSLLLLLHHFMQRRETVEPGKAAGPRLSKATVSLKEYLAVFISLGFVLPYFLVFSVFFKTSIVSVFDWSLLNQLGGPLVLSLLLAVVSSVGALCIVAIMLFTRNFLIKYFIWFEPVFSVLMSLPSGISVLVLALGMWLAYGHWVDPFSDTFAPFVIMAALQITLFYPLALRILLPVAEGSRLRFYRFLEVAKTLGASPFRAFFEVEWPRWRSPVLSVLGIISAISLGEVAAVSLFYNERLIPLPMLVSRWMAQYRFDEAQALSALLLIISGVFIIIFTDFAHTEGGFGK